MIANFLRFIRFSHTIFALPFALGAMFVAAGGLPSWQVVGLILLCMVFARTAAMTFNRLTDWEIDQRNPRTVARHTLASRPTAVWACVISSALFVLCSRGINPLCFALSPVALGIVFFYSLTKRFTAFAQFFLGFALAVAPVGAWLAVTGSFAEAPLILAAAVLCWVAGFDMIYATQDVEIDRKEGLKSMVVWLGVPRALALATVLHVVAFAGLVGFGCAAGLGRIYFGALVVAAGALVYEHRLARKGNVAAVNQAFFQANAFVSTIFVLSTFADRIASR